MKRILLATAVLAMLAPTAQASVFTSRLTFDGPQHTTTPVPFQGGGEDLLQDDSLTSFVDFEGLALPTISDGDIIYGIINMTNTDASGGGPQGIGQLEQITIVYSAMVSGAGSALGSFNLVPISDSGSPYDLRNLLPGIADFTTGPDDDSIFVILSNPTGTAESGGINPLSLNANTGGAMSIPDTITNLNGWTGDLVGGLLGGDDFFEFTGSFALGGQDRGAFSVQETTFGNVPFLPVDVLDFAGVKHLSDVTLDFGTVGTASGDQQSRGWEFRDQGSFFINAVPEPVSIVTWMGISILAGAAVMKRRRAQK